MSRQQTKTLSPHDLPKCYRELAAEAIAAGFTIVQTRNSHLAWHGPHGGIVHTGGTPGDWRSLRNNRARLEKYGLPKRTSGK